ncbi:TRAP transporter small permease [Prosthecomicrobium sp. N25]|uniref:TRAP transporter small permease n=1 Tax=Prosthecomicrobium sp. N25 TaxID=3129254 RepID=UPI003077CAD2
MPPVSSDPARLREEAAPPPGALRPVLGALARLNGVLAVACLWLAAFGIVAMTVVVGWQVFGRYVLNDTPTWAEPLTLQLMGWFIILGSAVGVREAFHLGLDLVQHVVPPVVAKVMDGISYVLIAAFGLAMTWYSWELAEGTWAATLPVLGIPGGWDFMPQVVGGVLLFLFALERLLGLVAGVEHEGVALQELA